MYIQLFYRLLQVDVSVLYKLKALYFNALLLNISKKILERDNATIEVI